MLATYERWLDQLEGLCRAADLDHVDLIVDQAGSDISLLPALEAIEPIIPWISFFSATPEETLLHQAPILMRIRLDDWHHKSWLQEIFEQMGHMPRLLVLVSPIPFDVLSKALQGLSQLEWGGQSGLLRFYDPRVLRPLLENVLDPEQKQRLLKLALFWSWLDRDQRIAWQPGTYGAHQPPEDANPPVVLTDPQFDRLGSISDAQKLMGIAVKAFLQLSREECFDRCYDVVLQASSENYFADLSAYAKRKFISMPEQQ
jgi:hypothetical protein